MGIKLGTADVSFRLGAATPSKVYFGATEVWSAITVPSAPTITSAQWNGFHTLVAFDAPASDGGSAILSVNVYFNGNLDAGGSLIDGSFAAGGTLQFDANYSNDNATIAAVNAVGEGPSSGGFEVENNA